ncbi:hypothetical protein DEU56DRAFT_919681 [Suillus clintonianus]|uniref:uncharacterized protein n=1 Tax=Suillus clintonianus TaxID=1904413 RepID=UPI001B85D3FE|nr:uncharacterized protein DEU56DRAFT_920529 [Suillus clintonianus]XP_041201352.1 uncharacterized protein DEU56DRAFT_919681 [Suillus clintonianus]KAG2108077.1 hypothetical protein DEU56DRAFT_920529 [Suillus clintonianus]KAG2113716.1 hypothetical protein DEU56DRAFT_919681 [Suillus clintonianus]
MDSVPSMSNVWLYMPQRNSVLRLIQLTNEVHPFVTFTGAEFVLIGYLADYTHIYPIYCDKLSPAGGYAPYPQFIRDNGESFASPDSSLIQLRNQLESGAYVRSINSTCCRPGVRGLALPSWLLPELNASVQFHHAPFPFGYPPPEHLVVPDSCAVETASFSASMPFSSGHPPLKHFGLADPVLQHAAEMPVIGTSAPCLDYTDLAYSDFNFYDHSTGYSASAVDEYLIPEDTNETQLELAFGEQQHTMYPSLEWRDSTNTGVDKNNRSQILRYMRRTPWNRIITLTRCLLIGGLWTGASGNPFRISATSMRRLITICFLTSLNMTHKTYEDMESHPVIARISETETVSAGWPVLRLSLVKSFSSAKSDLGKILKGAMSAHPDFAGTKTIEKAISFVLALNSGQSSQIQQAISDLISHQVYHILLLMVKDELKKRKIMSEAEVGNEAEAEVEVNIDIDASANILEPAPMNAIIMAALDHMYEHPHMYPTFSEAVRSLPFITSSNVLQIAAKSRLAKSTISDTTGDRRMVLEDVRPIVVQPIPSDQFGALPNSNGFSSPKSLRVAWDLPMSSFSRK